MLAFRDGRELLSKGHLIPLRMARRFYRQEEEAEPRRKSGERWFGAKMTEGGDLWLLMKQLPRGGNFKFIVIRFLRQPAVLGNALLRLVL